MSNAQTDYTYTSSNPAVKISNTQAVVTLTSTTKPTLPLNVTLTATPTDTKYSAVTYSFSITKWARMVGKSIYNTAQDLSGTYTAAIACGAPSTLSGASNRDVAASYFFKRSDITNIPSKSSMAPNIGTTSERFSRDIDGTFLGEWGVLYPSSGANPYPGSGVTTLAVWTSETRTSVNQYMVTLHQGYIGNNDRVDYVQWVVMCNN